MANPCEALERFAHRSAATVEPGWLAKQLPKGSATVHTARAFEDSDFVFTHSEYNFVAPTIGLNKLRL